MTRPQPSWRLDRVIGRRPPGQLLSIFEEFTVFGVRWKQVLAGLFRVQQIHRRHPHSQYARRMPYYIENKLWTHWATAATFRTSRLESIQTLMILASRQHFPFFAEWRVGALH